MSLTIRLKSLWWHLRGGYVPYWRQGYWWFRVHVWPAKRYSTKCSLCGLMTGITPYDWATQDLCTFCTTFVQEDFLEEVLAEGEALDPYFRAKVDQEVKRRQAERAEDAAERAADRVRKELGL